MSPVIMELSIQTSSEVALWGGRAAHRSLHFNSIANRFSSLDSVMQDQYQIMLGHETPIFFETFTKVRPTLYMSLIS